MLKDYERARRMRVQDNLVTGLAFLFLLGLFFFSGLQPRLPSQQPRIMSCMKNETGYACQQRLGSRYEVIQDPVTNRIWAESR